MSFLYNLNSVINQDEPKNLLNLLQSVCDSSYITKQIPISKHTEIFKRIQLFYYLYLCVIYVFFI